MKNTAPITSGKNGCAAWMLGSCLYMFLAADIIADAGFLAIPFQAIMGVIFSIVPMGVAYLAGFLFRFPALSRIWYSSALLPMAIIATAIIVLLLGESFGMTITARSPELGTSYQKLHPLAGLGSWFAAIFATLHFPTTKTSDLTHERNT
jgi:hypothetical protein